MQKNETGPYFTPCTKMNSKWINIMYEHKTWNHKILEESIGGKFLDIGLGWFFVSHTESKGNKYKNKQVGLHHIKKIQHSKGSP